MQTNVVVIGNKVRPNLPRILHAPWPPTANDRPARQPPSFAFAVAPRIVGRRSDVPETRDPKELLEVPRNELRTVVRDRPRRMAAELLAGAPAPVPTVCERHKRPARTAAPATGTAGSVVHRTPRPPPTPVVPPSGAHGRSGPSPLARSSSASVWPRTFLLGRCYESTSRDSRMSDSGQTATDPRGSAPRPFLVGYPHVIDVADMGKSAVNLIRFSRFAASRIRSRALGVPSSRRCVRHMSLRNGFPLARPLPSTSLRRHGPIRRHAVVRRLFRYDPPVRGLVPVHRRHTSRHFATRPATPPRQRPDTQSPGFRERCFRACTGSATPAGAGEARHKRPARYGLLSIWTASAPTTCRYYVAKHPARTCRCQRFAPGLTTSPA